MPDTEIPKAEIEREVQNRVIRVIRKNLPIYHHFGYFSDTENTNLELKFFRGFLLKNKSLQIHSHFFHHQNGV